MSIISPKLILEKGILQLPSTIDPEKVLQPNGIDLSISHIEEMDTHSDLVIIGDEVKTSHLKTRAMPLKPLYAFEEETQYLDKELQYKEGYLLKKGNTYKAETEYKLHLPEDMIAYIFTRSSLNRNGILTGSGLWDSGYHGPVGTTIYAFHDLILIPPCRIAQIVFMKADSALLYNGSYNVASMKITQSYKQQ